MVLRDHNSDNNKNTGSLGKPNSGLDERLYPTHDANFNVTGLVATNGQVVERYRYDAYGGVTFLNADFTPRTGNVSGKEWVHLFQGGRLETVTGNFHFRRRDYRPTLGRPLQQDPIGYADGANLYLWLLSNPGNRLDPLGLRNEAAAGDRASGWPSKAGPPPAAGSMPPYDPKMPSNTDCLKQGLVNLVEAAAQIVVGTINNSQPGLIYQATGNGTLIDPAQLSTEGKYAPEYGSHGTNVGVAQAGLTLVSVGVGPRGAPA